jgi:hypothetical protein
VDLGANALTCGAVTAGGNVGTTGEIAFTGRNARIFADATSVSVSTNFAVKLWIGNSSTQLRSDNTFGWSSTAAPSGTADLLLRRGGPGILHQHNGLNPQTY